MRFDEFVEALIAHDPGRALTAVARRHQPGRDPADPRPRSWSRHLRDGFLSLMAPELVQLPGTGAVVAAQAHGSARPRAGAGDRAARRDARRAAPCPRSAGAGRGRAVRLTPRGGRPRRRRADGPDRLEQAVATGGRRPPAAVRRRVDPATGEPARRPGPPGRHRGHRARLPPPAARPAPLRAAPAAPAQAPSAVTRRRRPPSQPSAARRTAERADTVDPPRSTRRAPAMPARRSTARAAARSAEIVPSLKPFVWSIYSVPRMQGVSETVRSPSGRRTSPIAPNASTIGAEWRRRRRGSPRSGAASRWWSTPAAVVTTTTTTIHHPSGRRPRRSASPAPRRRRCTRPARHPPTTTSTCTIWSTRHRTAVSPIDGSPRRSRAPADGRASLSGVASFTTRPGAHRRARPAPRHRPKSAQRIAFHLLKVPADDVMRLATAHRRQGEGALLRRCFNVTDDELCPICRDDRRDPSGLRGGRGPRHRRRRAHRRVQRPLPRAARRDEPARRDRPRAAQGPRAGRPPRARGHHRGHPVHQPQHRGRGDGDVPGPPAPPLGLRVTRWPAACRWAATSSTPTSSRSAGPSRAGATSPAESATHTPESLGQRPGVGVGVVRVDPVGVEGGAVERVGQPPGVVGQRRCDRRPVACDRRVGTVG